MPSNTICDEHKIIIKRALGNVANITDVFNLAELHPNTTKELTIKIHDIQNLLIAEYVRFTPLKEELELV